MTNKPNAPFKPPTSSKFSLPAKRSNCPLGTLGSRYASFKKPRKGDPIDDEDDEEECEPMNATQLNKHTLERRSLSSQKSSSQAAEETVGQFYSCVYRGFQTKMHKTWEADGYILLKPGTGCRLYDLDTRRFITEDTVSKRYQLYDGQVIFINSKEVLVGEKTTKDQLFSVGRKTHFSISNQQDQGKHDSQQDSVKAAFKPPKKILAGTSNNMQTANEKIEQISEEPITSGLFYGQNTSPRKIGITKRQYDLEACPLYSSEKYDDLIAMDRPDAKHQKRLNSRDRSVVDVHINPLLSSKMRPDQIEGVKFLYNGVMEMRTLVESSEFDDDDDDDESREGEAPESAGVILADEMGLGKTLQTIAVIDMLLRQNCYFLPKRRYTIERALVVCPATLVNNWKLEFTKWLGREFRVQCVDERTNIKSIINGKFDVLIINYEKVRNFTSLLASAQPGFGLLICDEAHTIRNADSQITKALENLRIARRILLTGTPIQNNLAEFYTMINFVAGDYLGDYATFKKHFEGPITRGRKPNCLPQHRAKAEQRSRLLQKITAPLLLRRTAEVVNHLLPPKHEIVLFCNPSPLQHELYEALSSLSGKESTSELKRTAFERIILLKKLCSAPDLVIEDVHDKGKMGKRTRKIMGNAYNIVPKRKTERAEDSGKLLALLKLLKVIKERTNDKVILVSHFTVTLDILERVCEGMKYPCLRLDGNVKQNIRSSIVHEFNTSDSKSRFIMLLSAKAGGAGLNLIGANRLFMLDGDWNPAIDQQAMGRIHRSGQMKECFIYRLMLSGTLDEKIFQRQNSKMGLSDALMIKSKEPSTSSRQLSQKGSNLADDFSEAELTAIFRYQSDTPCSTHEMLQCPCGGKGTLLNGINTLLQDHNNLTKVGFDDEEDKREEEEDDDDDDVEYDKIGFIPASQVTEAMSKQKIKENRKKLASLFDWTHHDFSKADKSVLTQDQILNEIIEKDAQYRKMRNDDKDENDTFSSKSQPSGAILYVFAKRGTRVEKANVSIENMREDGFVEGEEETEEEEER